MKRTISLWLGLLAFALLPAIAQTPESTKLTAKIHGHITNPTGAPQSGGTVTLVAVGQPVGPGMSAKTTEKGVFTVDGNGDYSGEAAPGKYDVIYRAPGIAANMVTDKFEGVTLVAGQDTAQDFDMSRKEYIDLLSADQRKQLDDLKKHNAEAIKTNAIIRGLNADLKTAADDFRDADAAQATATQALGASASKSAIDVKEAEIKTAKYTEVETMMLKDTGAKPDASVLWVQLGQAQLGLKKYDDAEASYKKALELEAASKKPSPTVQGSANDGLGEVYARLGKVQEANAAVDEAAKINPKQAAIYLKNEAVIFFQEHNSDAQAAAAEEAIKADPTSAIAYYLKGNGLIAKTTEDTTTHKLVAPPGCLEAYQKYLDLAPTGPYAAEVKGILAGFQATLPTAGPVKSKRK